MRKQDYTILAQIFKSEIATLKGYIARGDGTETRNVQDQCSLQIAALRCANELHVDKAEFLKACGID